MKKDNIVLKHIAFIMDGNRRWAKARKMPLLLGHKKGAERIEPLVEYAARRGIEYITFWAFSSENWRRGEEEVGFLMRVFRDFLGSTVVKRMMEKGVRVKVIGDLGKFPEDIVDGVNKILERSENNKTITATFALNYGGRSEILSAVNRILEMDMRLKEGVSEEVFSSYLFTDELPDPDLIVRTGGEKRLSGFLPWQSVYSELCFVDTLWPDIDERKFDELIVEYGRRERRFGK